MKTLQDALRKIAKRARQDWTLENRPDLLFAALAEELDAQEAEQAEFETQLAAELTRDIYGV